ncbi:hypothetical protein BV25DRAFT_1822555 [Artomyces pyxidatus]|uniref:Uncharacterized protein n=1 Tax=Artomyces pyxidatus TaxID=48021 RepID=A0ACB8T8E4_9AGAM|nr:hypothetical protein BV25DRAFT_1822555 [Artomyces pyxidatus]
MLMLLVARFSQMDIVIHASIHDAPEENPEQTELERQTQTFLGSVAGLRLVSGLLGLLLERSDIIAITQTRMRVAPYPVPYFT